MRSWIEKHNVRTSVWLKNVPHWWAIPTSKCLYMGGGSSKGMPLGYPLLWTGERLEKNKYITRATTTPPSVRPAGSDRIGLGSKRYLCLRIKLTWSSIHLFFVTNSPYKRRARPTHSSHRKFTVDDSCAFSSLLPLSTCNESFFCFYSFLSLRFQIEWLHIIFEWF